MSGPIAIDEQGARPVSDATGDAATVIARAHRGELLTGHDLQLIFGLKKSAFHRAQAGGEFEPFRVRPAIGPRIYSGVLITRYLAGEWIGESPRFTFKGRRK